MPRPKLHRVDRYARDVVKGTIVAGPYVRLAAARHVRDKDDAASKGFRFDVDAADHAIGFIETWVRLPDTSDDAGRPRPFVLQPWQAFIVGSIFGWKWASGFRRFRNAYIEVGKGNGKALALDTPIPTAAGWTTMGAIRPGDVLFDERGHQTRVVGAYDVMYDHPCYRVTFDDGSSIVADAQHLWRTEQRSGPLRIGLHTTARIAATLRYKNGKYQSANHSIPVAGPLATDSVLLPIEPYVLGVWLGDGDSDCARITVDDRDAELISHLAAVGARIGERQQTPERTPRYRVSGLQSQLRTCGLLQRKHIPAAYLRATVEERLGLLQGLMDTDGSISKTNGQCEFSTTTEVLAHGVRELAISLGIKVSFRRGVATLYGRDVSPVWRLSFFPPADLPVFRLRRKLMYQAVRHARRRLSGDHRIVACESVESVPVRCIAVDSPSSLFLAGRSMVATHNTPLLAAIGLYGLMMDGQTAPEIYAAASDRDQAMIMFRDAVRMVQASPELSKRIKQSGIEHVHNMAYGLGFFRPFSREQGARSGTRPHMGLIDELHEHPNAEATAKIRAGAKGNQDALFAEITNSGFDRASICWQHHEHALRVVEQLLDDERWFSYVCALDEGDDPLTDTRCHIKTNPNLGVSIHTTYLADQVDTARNIPAETNMVLRLNFCVWTQSHSPAWDMAKWRQSSDPIPDLQTLVGRPCFGGLDLGQNDDFSAWVRLWELDDDRLLVVCKCWIPQSALTKYPNRPYQEWIREGLLTVTDGDTTDLDVVEATVLADARASGVSEIAYDKRFAQHLALHLQGAGLNVVDVPQGYALNESIKSLSKAIADGTVVHGGNRLFSWMMDNCVLRTGRNNEQRLDKEQAKDKIDGPAALVMANARRIVHVETRPPQYQMFVFGGTR